MKALVPLLTPQGRLTLDWAEDAAPFAEDVAGRIEAAFARGHGHGLLQLGAGEIRTTLPPAFSYWREFAGRFVTAVCGHPDAEEHKHLHIPSPDPLELEVLASAVPLMTGAEYLSGNVLRGLWEALETAFHHERDAAGVSVQEFLRAKNPAWNLVGRVHFNLAEKIKKAQFKIGKLTSRSATMPAIWAAVLAA